MAPDDEIASFIRSNFRSVWALELIGFLAVPEITVEERSRLFLPRPAAFPPILVSIRRKNRPA